MEFLASNWFYLIYVVVFGFIMFKGGGCCGGHSSEGHSSEGHSHDNSHGGGCCGGGAHEDTENDSTIYDGTNENIKGEKLVKDPICGMFIGPTSSIKMTINGETYFFCSEACRREFLNQREVM